jgi:hypothetical protein
MGGERVREWGGRRKGISCLFVFSPMHAKMLVFRIRVQAVLSLSTICLKKGNLYDFHVNKCLFSH